MSLKITDFFENLRNEIDIVDVISDYLTLQREGNNYKAVCPFHPDRNPSLYVSPAKKIWKCFGCGKGGDVIKFVAEYEGISYYQASIKLAEKYGIEIPKDIINIKSEFEKYVYALNRVKEFYKKALPNFKKARDYLIKERKLSTYSIEEFEIGYAPNDNSLIEFAKKENILDLLIELGHIKEVEKGKYIDLFAGRIVFPIKNLTGKVIAFAGRLIEDKKNKPKYINSPNSKIFKKENNLFGLHRAKEYIREKKKVFIVEGYFDVIRLHEKGIGYSVASMGTALTDKQIKKLKNLGVKEWYLIYDGDKAGKKALLKNAKSLFIKGFNPYLVFLPENLDPDDYLRDIPKQSFLSYIRENKITFWDFIIREIKSSRDLIKKNERIKKFIKLIKQVEDILLQYLYLSELKETLQIDDKVFETLVEKAEEELKSKRKEPKKENLQDVKENLSFLIKEIEFKFLKTLAYLYKRNEIDLNYFSYDFTEEGNKIFELIKNKEFSQLPFSLDEDITYEELLNEYLIYDKQLKRLKHFEEILKLVNLEEKIKNFEATMEEWKFYRQRKKEIGEFFYEYIKDKIGLNLINQIIQ
jgi:DNA primase